MSSTVGLGFTERTSRREVSVSKMGGEGYYERGEKLAIGSCPLNKADHLYYDTLSKRLVTENHGAFIEQRYTIKFYIKLGKTGRDSRYE